VRWRRAGGPEASLSEFYLNERPYTAIGREPLVCGAEMVRCFRNAVRSIQRTKLKQVETLSCVLRPPTPEGGGGKNEDR
jgi:hypothetical protein